MSGLSPGSLGPKTSAVMVVTSLPVLREMASITPMFLSSSTTSKASCGSPVIGLTKMMSIVALEGGGLVYVIHAHFTEYRGIQHPCKVQREGAAQRYLIQISAPSHLVFCRGCGVGGTISSPPGGVHELTGRDNSMEHRFRLVTSSAVGGVSAAAHNQTRANISGDISMNRGSQEVVKTS